MNKEFTPYKEALALKGLGFDEECLFRYTAQEDLTNKGCYDNSSPYDAMLTADVIHESHILAPLYQQVFRWFREKYKLDSMVQPTYSTKYQYRMFHIEGKTKVQIYGAYMGKAFKTYEEAELACLRKLIEIVNQNKDELEL